MKYSLRQIKKVAVVIVHITTATMLNPQYAEKKRVISLISIFL
jgi:hypothetical protein